MLTSFLAHDWENDRQKVQPTDWARVDQLSERNVCLEGISM